MRRLPSLSALRVFEAAARLGGFKRAADELAVTPTAVSHQIRALEEQLDTPLFKRSTRKVTLTPAGSALFPVVRDGFDAVADTVERLTRKRLRPQITIAATIGFTARWLVPRLAGFQARHPDIDLQLLASDDVVDLASDVVDLAIRYGQGGYPEAMSTVLFEDAFAPVANPLLGIEGEGSLREVPLIEFEWRRAHPINPTWERWFEAKGLDLPASSARLRFSDESHAIQSAIAGQGVALASLTLVSSEIAAGQLVRPFAGTLPGHRHHLLTKTNLSPAAKEVAQWLVDEARLAMGPQPDPPPT